MLSQLYIRDYAIVPKMELSLAPQLTVLTGETGAGKSIVIDALALALGERAVSGVIRHGCQRAEIIAGFDLKPKQDAARWLQEHDLFEDQECVLRRVINADKPSKGYINGRPVPIQMLRELGELLVDIHGQHEHQSLLKRDAQRQILDDYADLTGSARLLGEHYEGMKSLQARLHTLHKQSSDRAARIELLRYQVNELETLALGTDEVAALEDEHARLANGAALLEGVQAAAYVLYDDDEHSLSHVLSQTINKLEGLTQHDVKLEESVMLLNEAAIQVNETATQLHQYLDGLELDPQRLEWVDQRLAVITDLARKHQVEGQALPQVLERLSQELDDIEDADTSIARLEAESAQAQAAYLSLAKEISAQRGTAAGRLAEAVSGHMQDLGMPGGSFAVELLTLAEGEFSPYGLERVEFRVSANPGQPLQLLAKVASGGELSRVSLALQVVIASLGRIPTLIFDEVDVGIGGGVAEIVGKELRALGKSRQVFCITHLAQVAAQGDQHLQVSKLNRDGLTITEVLPLPGEERVKEIARMIGGVEISQQTLAHAEDMLNRASA